MQNREAGPDPTRSQLAGEHGEDPHFALRSMAGLGGREGEGGPWADLLPLVSPEAENDRRKPVRQKSKPPSWAAFRFHDRVADFVPL